MRWIPMAFCQPAATESGPSICDAAEHEPPPSPPICLSPDAGESVATFVRHGGGGFMPAFRPTEVSDEDLKALGAYLARRR